MKIVSSRFGDPEAHTLKGYLATEGYRALDAALSKTPEAVVDTVKAASLEGRGGAGFPAGVKWGFLPSGVYPRYLVINGDESEPGTYKDRMLLELDPHQVIEGALITAYAIRADQVFIYVRGEMALAQERMIAAVNEAYREGYIGKRIMGRAWGIDVVVHGGAGAYIVGEETALLESLEGKRGEPRLKPPYFPAITGLYGQPTIVNNVETVATVPWIVRKGGEKYAKLGGERSKGTRLFAVSGHVERPGVYEVELGRTSFRELIYGKKTAQGIWKGRQLKAFVPGGASAPWLYEEHLDLPLSMPEVQSAGSMLGSGAVMVMDETTDAVRAAWRIVKFFAHESCGQCTPCREGTNWLERILSRVLQRQASMKDLDTLIDIADNITPGITWPPKQTTICPLGPSAVSPIASSIVRFRQEYAAYLKGGKS